MRIYDRKGMLVIPTPPKKSDCNGKDLLLVKECFCRNGHNLINKCVSFSGFDGIYLRARAGNQEGYIGLSPVYGEKCRISLDIDLKSGEISQLLCPTCGIDLPVFSTCHCGAGIMTLFLNPRSDFTDSIGICGRVDCTNSVVRSEGELLSLTMVNSSKRKSGMRFFRGLPL